MYFVHVERFLDPLLYISTPDEISSQLVVLDIFKHHGIAIFCVRRTELVFA